MTDDQRSKSSSGDSLVRLLEEAASTGRPVVSDEVIELPPLTEAFRRAADIETECHTFRAGLAAMDEAKRHRLLYGEWPIQSPFDDFAIDGAGGMDDDADDAEGDDD